MGRLPIGKVAMTGAERVRLYRLKHPVTKQNAATAAEITALKAELAAAGARIVGLEAELRDAELGERWRQGAMAMKPSKLPSRNRLIDHPEYARLIGLISIETVDLGVELAGLFARMLGLPLKIGRAILLAPKNEQTRLDILKNAATAAFAPRSKVASKLEIQKAEALKSVVAIIKRSHDAINQRHRVVHDEWAVSDKGEEITRRNVNGQITREGTSVPIKELEDQVHSLRVLIDDIFALAAKFRENPPTMVTLNISPKKST